MERVSPRGFVAERIFYSSTLDPYLSLKALADYSGLSVRTLRSYVMERVPERALPVYRLRGGKLLVRMSEFDAWMARWRCQGRPAVVAAARELGIGATPE